MNRKRFCDCLAFVLRWEGGLVDDASDPGGETNHGISENGHPGVDVSALSIKDAAAIYKRDYWDKYRCAALPIGIDLAVFNNSIMSGQAIHILQRLVGVEDDGLVGNQTIGAISSHIANHGGTEALLLQYLAEMVVYWSGLSTWETYRRGWCRRLFDLALETN